MKVYIIDPQSMRTLARLTAQSWDLCPDAWDTESSSISVTGAVPQHAKKLLLAQGRLYFIDAVTPEKGSSAKLSLKLPDHLFDRELIYAPDPEDPPATIGGFLEDTITAEWIEQADSVYALPKIRIVNEDETAFIEPEADEDSGLYSFLDYLRTVRRDHGVTLSFAQDGGELLLRIHKAEPRTVTLIDGDGKTTVEKLTWASAGVAKITSIQKVDTGETDEEDQKIYETQVRDWYLSAEGVPSETPPQTRAEGAWEKLTVSEKDDAAEKVAERFQRSRSSDHKIELHSDEVMAVGDRFRLRYKGAVYEGTVSCVRQKSGESRALYRSGDFATTMIDKVRSSLRKE